MINNVSFKGNYLIKSPTDMGFSKETNTEYLRSALGYIPIATVSQTSEGDVRLRIPGTKNHSEYDKRELKAAICGVYTPLLRLGEKDAKNLEMRFNREVKDKEENNMLSATIDLKIKADGEQEHDDIDDCLKGAFGEDDLLEAPPQAGRFLEVNAPRKVLRLVVDNT